MTMVGVHEAKTQLSQLLRRVAAGEEVIICNGGKPAARLVAIAPDAPQRVGLFRGAITLSDDFDDTPEYLREFFE